METFVSLLIISIMCFICVVTIVKLTTQKSIEESTKVCVDQFVRICRATYKVLHTSNPKITYYPVYIGYIDNLVHPKRVEYYFRDLKKIYDIVDFDITYSHNQNVNVYRFTCIGLKQDIEEKELISVLSKISVLALKRYQADNNLFNTVTTLTPLVTTELISNDLLTVYIARTDMGLSDIQQIEKRVKDSYLASKNDPTDLPIIDEWEEDFWT